MSPSKAAAYLRYEASYRTLSFSIANSSNQPTLTFSDPPLTITADEAKQSLDLLNEIVGRLGKEIAR